MDLEGVRRSLDKVVQRATELLPRRACNARGAQSVYRGCLDLVIFKPAIMSETTEEELVLELSDRTEGEPARVMGEPTGTLAGQRPRGSV